MRSTPRCSTSSARRSRILKTTAQPAPGADWRRRLISTVLIRTFGRIAKEAGGWAVFVQGARGDAPGVALYEGLGGREDVLRFDIAPE